MNIPFAYYLGYWFKNSLLALATGFLIALLIPPLFAVFPLAGLILFIMYQVVIYRHFWGKRRGDFEFYAREIHLEKNINSLIIHNIGLRELIRYKLDHLNSIVTYGWDVHKKLVEHLNHQNEKLQFYLNLIAADLSRKEDDYKNELKSLLNAISAVPDEPISNYRLAVAFEKEGRSEESIKYYRKALAGC